MNRLERMQWRLSKGANALRQIIIVNLLVFVVSLLITIIGKLMVNNAGDVLEYFYLPSNLKLLLIRPWTLLTNIFMHFDLKHILINMLVLYMIGRILQDFVSNNQFWTIFMGGALLGSLFYLFSYNVFPAFKDVVGQSMLMGASGGVTAITVATGVFVPNFEVRLFGVLPIKMKWIAGIMVLIDLYSLPQMSNTGGVLAHLGGAIFGATYILNMRGRLNLPRISFRVGKKSKMKVVHYDERIIQRNREKMNSKPNQEEIDAILDKINQSGYDSLTRDEKETLIKASE